MNLFYVTILLFQFINVNTNNNGIVKLSYTNSAGTYFWRVNIGSTNQFHYFTIDLKHNFNFGTNFKYIKELSQTIETVSIEKVTIDSTLYSNAVLLQDSICLTLTNQTIIHMNEFYFYDLEQTGLFFVDRISLARFNNENKHFSILHMLHNKGYIKTLSFAFMPHDDIGNNKETLKNGTLFLGGIPVEYTLNKTKASCKCDITKSYWSCLIMKIQIGNKVHYNFENGINLYFRVNKDDFYFPTQIYESIVNEIFSPLFIKDICRYEKYTQRTKCSCNNILHNYSFPQVTIILNGMSLVFDNTDNLFLRYHDICYFFISPHDNDEFIIGTKILQEFITEFNIETNDITFYSDNHIKIYTHNNTKNYHCKILYCIIYFLLSIFIVYNILILKCIYNKRTY